MKWLLVLATLFAASPVYAQQQCAPYQKMTEFLSEKHQERRTWAAIMDVPNGAVEIELWQSKNGSWTMLALRGDMACMIHTGQSGEALIVGDEV